MSFFIVTLILLAAGFGVEAVAQELEGSVPDTIFVSTVRFGECDSVDIPILNAGSTPFVIDTIRLGSGETGFALSDIFSLNLSRLDPDSSHFVRLRFCPDTLVCFADSLFVEISSTDGTKHRTYGIGVGGCSGAPELEVDREEIVFEQKAIGMCDEARLRLSNRGDFPLLIEELQFGNDAFHLDPGIPAAPFIIPSGEGREILLRFCPRNQGEIEGELRIISDAHTPVSPVRLQGRGLFSRFGTEAEIDFGEVPVGTARDTLLIIRNLDANAPLTIVHAGPDNAATAGGFDVETISPPITRIVRPGDTIHLHLRFHPATPGNAGGGILFEDDRGLTEEVLVKGTGITPGIRLDTAYAEAGDTLALTLRVDATGEIKPRIGAYRITLRLPPHSLFPKEVMPLQGASATMNYETDGTLTIEGENEEKELIDGRLLIIRFRGLSTGDSINPVIIEEALITGVTHFAVTGHGLAVLSGCDIGRSAPVMRKLLIRSVTPNPIADQAAITYRVPSGSTPLLRLFSINGAREFAIPLPEGNGEDQTIPTRFNDLLPGLYLLELRVGEASDVTTILIEPNGD